MKRLALVACLGLFGLTASAQTQLQKGRLLVGGTGALGLTALGETENDDNSSTTFGLNVQGGYFFTDNLAAGLLINWNSVTSDNGSNETTNSSFTIGPFVRYYFPIAERLAVYPQLSIGFGGATNESVVDLPSGGTQVRGTDDTAWNWGLGVGGAYFIGDQVSIDLFLGYNRINTTTEVVEAGTGRTFDVDRDRGQFGANIGFNIFF